MAIVYLSPNDNNYVISNSNTTVIGVGTNSILISDGVSGITISSTIGRVAFAFGSEEAKLSKGFGATVDILNSSGIKVATMASAGGKTLAFGDSGGSTVTYDSSSNSISFGGIPVTADTSIMDAVLDTNMTFGSFGGNSGNSGNSGGSNFNPFSGINIQSRGVTLNGYTITYTPSNVKTVTTAEQYSVTAVVTYNATGELKTYSFMEWAYPTDATTDAFGRTFVDMSTLPDGECKTYLISSGYRVVASKGDTTDEMIASAYQDVLGRNFISSEAFNYWMVQVTNNSWDMDTLKQAIATAASSGTEACPNAKSNAQGYLASIDVSISRNVIPMTSVPSGACKNKVANNNDVFVLSSGSTNDEMIKNAYNEVLDRQYISDSAYKYWNEQITDNNWSLATLKQAIANSAIADDSCQANRYNAYIYLNSVTPEGRSYIKMTQITSTPENDECLAVTLLKKDFNYIYVQSLGDEFDTRIFTAYKAIINRDYISDFAVKYWRNNLVNDNWTDTNLYTAIKDSASKDHGLCPASKANAQTYDLSIIENSSYFDNILIDKRGMKLSGYTITYDPVTAPIVDEAGEYSVVATVVHIASGASKVFTFSEYLYPVNANADRYGRDITPTDNITNTELKKYAQETGTVFVSPAVNDNDSKVKDLYASSMMINFIDSESLERWSNYVNDNPDVSDSALEIMIIDDFINTHSSCVNAILNARYRKSFLNEQTSRPRIDAYSLSDTECKLAIKNADSFISDATEDDDTETMIKSTYLSVLGRDFLSDYAYSYWHNDIVENSLTEDDFKTKVAHASLNNEEYCPVAKSYAYKYLNPQDPYNKNYITYDLIPTTGADGEYRTVNIVKNSLGSLYVEYDETDDIDVKIKKAYKLVLDRDYITSSALHYWVDAWNTNEWNLCDLKLAIANGAIDNPENCPIAKANAQTYLDIGTSSCGVNVLDKFGDNSAVALYQLDGNANDTGGAYNGAWSGTEQYDIGKFGEAVDMINTPNSTYIKTPVIDRKGSKEITISGWVKVLSDLDDHSSIWHLTPNDDDNTSSNSRQPALWFTPDSSTKFYIRNDGVDTYDLGISKSSESITYNEWHFITQVVTLRQMKFYIDGTLTDIYDSNEDFKFNNGYFYIGDKWYSKNHLIDQVRIFNRALTEDEIGILYNEHG